MRYKDNQYKKAQEHKSNHSKRYGRNSGSLLSLDNEKRLTDGTS